MKGGERMEHKDRKQRDERKSDRLNNFALGFSIFTLLVVIFVEVIVK